ncbi:hypothetical protein A4G20_03165 [Pasteurellaceae bacterium RH1A]|nr:hypothetical protein A4G20_03165 [Pasteurellaceae bacterium RH1A]
MLSENFIEHLNESLGRIFFQESQNYIKLLQDLGLSQEKNEDFIYFWSTYSDEIYGKFGYLMDFCMDIEDLETSETFRLRQAYNLPHQYLSFMGEDIEDYLFYDIKSDKVYLVEADGLNDFIEHQQAEKEWESFLAFIQDFLGYIEP